MNVEEIQAVLGYLSAAYPGLELAEQTVTVWADQLGGVRGDTAVQAAREWVAEEDRFPTVGKFRALCIAVARRERDAENFHRPALHAVDDPVTPPEVAAENVRKIKVALKQIGKRA